MAYGRIPRLPRVIPSEEDTLSFVLSDIDTCMGTIGLTPKEFYILLPEMERRMETAGGLRGGNARTYSYKLRPIHRF